MHFHDCIITGRTPITSGDDALRDIALCEAVVAAHLSHSACEEPTNLAASGSRPFGKH